jgi:hypothetical protein
VQQRFGSDKLAVVLIDVDPEYFKDPNDYLPQAKKIMEKKKLDCPNVLAPKGFHNVIHAFNVSGYGNILVDEKGIVRGVNVHGEELERLMEEIMHVKKGEKKGIQK